MVLKHLSELDWAEDKPDSLRTWHREGYFGKVSFFSIQRCGVGRLELRVIQERGAFSEAATETELESDGATKYVFSVWENKRLIDSQCGSHARELFRRVRAKVRGAEVLISVMTAKLEKMSYEGAPT